MGFLRSQSLSISFGSTFCICTDARFRRELCFNFKIFAPVVTFSSTVFKSFLSYRTVVFRWLDFSKSSHKFGAIIVFRFWSVPVDFGKFTYVSSICASKNFQFLGFLSMSPAVEFIVGPKILSHNWRV